MRGLKEQVLYGKPMRRRGRCFGILTLTRLRTVLHKGRGSMDNITWISTDVYSLWLAFIVCRKV